MSTSDPADKNYLGCTGYRAKKTFVSYVDDEELLLGMLVRLNKHGGASHLFIQDLPKWGITEIDDIASGVILYTLYYYEI
ncbi:MAG: hypothetical protein U5K71_16805 [Gracilimonas sp.]|nr:hypothetical protein [Gracilimonas sp.]